MPDFLRSGFTTGAAMTAGALAVWSARSGKTTEAADLLLPDGSMLSVPIAYCDMQRAVVIKDAGDDPDATDRARISVEFRPGVPTELDAADYQEVCGKALVMIRGGRGIGRVTRPGLAVPVGKWAINPGPRRLLVRNLDRAGLSDGTWLLTVSIEDGARIAEKTLNPTLGITGGLSIFINAVNLVMGNYYAAGTGLLFGFTYIFVAFSKLWNLSPIPFAWFSTFVAVNAVVFGTIEGVTGSAALNVTADWRWAAIWYLWAILWGTSFVEDICGKKLGKFVPCLQVFEGVVTAWIPGLLMLIGQW